MRHGDVCGSASSVTQLADPPARSPPVSALSLFLAGRLHVIVGNSNRQRYSNRHAGWTKCEGERQQACCYCYVFFFAPYL